MFWSRKPKSPQALFAALGKAVRRDDRRGFADLCRSNEDAIVAAFPGWQKPGDDLDTRDAAAVNARIQVLGHIAQYFLQVLERPELWEALTGGDGDDPFSRWDAARDEIAQRVRALDYDGAIALSRELIADVQACTGNAADEAEELARGQLGQLLLHRGRTEEALPELRWTLARCRERGDEVGIGVYLHALHDADRYAGRPSRWRGELAEHLEAAGESEAAARHRTVGARFVDGEPLLRLVAQVDGRVHELQDVSSDLAQAEVLFERSRPTLAPAVRWIDRGRRHLEAGDDDEAARCFEAAAELDPWDPDSRYQLAFLHMMADAPSAALPLYDEIEQIAPGWFQARTWRSLAARQLEGEIPHEVVRLVDLLQDGGLDAERRLELTREPIVRWPRVPELFLFRGRAMSELGLDGARDAWLAGLEVCDDLPATRSRLLLELGRDSAVLALDGADLMCQAFATLRLQLAD